jgi:hypothetical protein
LANDVASAILGRRMANRSSIASEEGAAPELPFECASLPASNATELTRPMSATHEVLFETDGARRCDACGGPLPVEDDDAGYGLGGQGVYMWTRGDEVRFETAPLCSSCASAIGMTALARWEIEEEEG